MKQVIVLRKDLGMNKGKMIAQGAHASMMFMVGTTLSDKERKWLYGGMAKIAVGVDSLEDLEELQRLANEKGLRCHAVVDSGKTVVDPGTKTAIAIGPNENEEIDKITGSLKLL
jgi:peptidyl-tRNA hydrolase, PTH2 family